MSKEIIEEIREMKEEHALRMDKSAEQIKSFIKVHRDIDSGYLDNQRGLVTYHRGAYNALLSLENSIIKQGGD